MLSMTIGTWIDGVVTAMRATHGGEPRDRSELDDYWYNPIGAPVWAGAVVTPDTALTVPMVWNCLNVISKPIATLPLIFYEREPSGGKKRFDRHPLFDVLHSRPNKTQSACEFRGQMMWDIGIHNAAFAEILPGPRGAVDQLIRLDPQRVTAKRVRPPDGPVMFRYHPPGGGTRMLRDDQVWHLKGFPMSFDEVNPVSPVLSGPGRQTIGKALAIMQYASRFFLNDTSGGGIIKHPGKFKETSDRENWLRAWRTARSGANRHRDALLEHGMEYVRPGQTNREAQFIEATKESDLAIARIWNIPPHKVGILDRATFSNIEQQSLEFVTDTMLPWLTLWEQAISRDLMVAPGRFFAEFNVAGLLRGDLRARYEAYAIGRNWGWLSVNDILKLENSNEIGVEGDIYLRPMNMVPAGTPGDPSGQGKPNGSGRSDKAFQEIILSPPGTDEGDDDAQL